MNFNRGPRYAGRFYPERSRALVSMLQDIYGKVESIQKKIYAKGIILPHGAYHYSGIVGMSVLKCIELPDTAIIFAPNHSGLGKDVTIVTAGNFDTPIGWVAINEGLSKKILKEIPYVSEDIQSHLIEHSIEVQLPMLKYLKNDIRIVPLLLKKIKFELLTSLIGNFISFFKSHSNNVLFIATSDLSHYDSYDETIRKDKIAIECIQKMDILRLRKSVDEEKIKMCGYECVAHIIELAKASGATSSILRRYDTSSSIDGNYDNVVGYAGICFV